MEPINSARTAATLNDLKKQVDEVRRRVEAGLRAGENPEALHVKKTVAFRAVNSINALRNNLRNWYTFYNGYDPIFTWWNEEPYKAFDETLTSYASFINERLLGLRANTPAGQTGQQGGGQRTGTGGGGAPGGSGGFQRPGAAQARPGDT